MGLDIIHFKATFKRPSFVEPSLQEGMIIEEYYEGFNVRFSYFSKYIHLLDCPITKETLIIPRHEHLVDKIKKRISRRENTFWSNRKRAE